jgi:dipeptidyl-peptidase III
MKASWESIVNFKNLEASERTHTISDNAQWFEDNSPVDSRFKKDKVKGVSAKVITAAMLAGDCYPSTPIGNNLPDP